MSRTRHLTRIPAVAGLALAGTTLAGAALAGPAQAAVSGPAFWIDGAVCRTVATPTDLSGTGAPESSYDALCSFGGAQLDVAEAKPGGPDFNGGRWEVHELAFPSGYAAALASGDANGNGVIDSTAELDQAFAALVPTVVLFTSKAAADRHLITEADIGAAIRRRDAIAMPLEAAALHGNSCHRVRQLAAPLR